MGIAQSFNWDDLLEYIDDRRVVPIIGWDLLLTPVEGKVVRLDRLVAGRMAQKLGLPALSGETTDAGRVGRGEGDPMDEMVRNFEMTGGHADQLYPRLRSVLREKFATPEPLKQLARISHFRLFVTTTFDGLLEQALQEERGQPATSLAFSLTGQDDLPEQEGAQPLVYHLLGKSNSTVPDCVLSQEHMLEYFHHLQRKGLPDRLADVLRQSHLLLIGNHLTDWIVRILLRIAKGERLISPRGCSEIVADPAAGRDGDLVVFLRSFSPSTQIFTGGDAAEFVAELARRYAERHPPKSNDKGVARAAGSAVGGAAGELSGEWSGEAGAGEEAPAMPPGAVFISYASQDLAAATRLHADLEAAGIDTWIDKRALEVGEEFNLKIARSIRSCSLFVPLISANTQARVEGYFRQEWNLAAERAMRMDDSVRFILPVVIDGTAFDESCRVPGRFRGLHWTALPGGQCTPGFVEQVKNLVRDVHRRQRAPGGAPAGSGGGR